MKSPKWDADLHREFREFIQTPEAQAAYDEMSSRVVALPDYYGEPAWKGDVRNFRYLDPTTGERPFSFITNRTDLLFYVRNTGKQRVLGGLAALRRLFPHVNENPSGEWTVRVKNAKEAQDLSEFLFASHAVHGSQGSAGDKARGSRRHAHLITYKPATENAEKGWPLAELRRLVSLHTEGKPTVENWRFHGHRQALEGDRVFLLLQGIKGPGIIGYGTVAGAPVKTGRQWQVPIHFDSIVDPDLEALATRAELRRIDGSAKTWRTQSSGIRLAPAIAEALEKLVVGRHTTDGRLDEDAAEERIQQRTDIGPTEKLNLVKSRRGQGVYRENLEQIEKKCRVTGVLDRRHLRASHIKPWSVCDDREKLDGSNGLLLSPHVDHLFDRGYISFADSGDLLVSKDLNRAVLESWSIALPQNVGPFTEGQRHYLEYHRAHVFGKSNIGRRVSSAEAAEEPEVAVLGEPVVVRPG